MSRIDSCALNSHKAFHQIKNVDAVKLATSLLGELGEAEALREKA